MSHIFVSYSRADKDYVMKLVDSLESKGYDVWYDLEMFTGDEWADHIKARIDNCDAFIVVMTQNSEESVWVKREVLYAMQKKKRIFPLLLQGELWMLLQDKNYANVIGGVSPDEKFFRHLSTIVPRNSDWEIREKARLAVKESERERIRKEKEEREAAEKLQRKIDKRKKDLQSKYKREIFFSRLRNKLGLVFLYFRYYIFPATLILGVMAGGFYYGKPFFDKVMSPTQEILVVQTATLQADETKSVIPSETLAPISIPTEIVTPTPLPTDNEKIAYVSLCNYPQLCSKIIVMNADGSEQKDITANSPMLYNRYPEFSYDGTKLLFVGSNSYDTGASSLYMVNINNLEVILIREFDSTIRNISWSPDGENVIYDTYVDKIGIEIEKYNLTTKEIVNIVTYSRYANSPSWSFDGSKVAYIDGQFGLYIMDPDGTHRQYIYDYVGCDNPSFSSVGFEIVASCDKNEADLFIFETTSKKIVPITYFQGMEKEPAWSPDGEWIVFVSNMEACLYQTAPCQGGDYDVYKIRPDGSGLTRLTFDGESKQYPVWGR